MTEMDIEKLKKAGKIAAAAASFAQSFIKKDMPLLEITEKIEAKIKESGAELAFPINLSKNELAAHYTARHIDETLASGLLKVDIGVHVDGWIADTAFSIDLDDNDENKKLIQASKAALKAAISSIGIGVEIKEVGKAVQKAIESHGFSPIKDLCGHEVARYIVHAGLTIPNYDNGNNNKFKAGVYAIEPFATAGIGRIYEGNESGIYKFETKNPVRDNLAREILDYIEKEHVTMPFSAREIVNKFSSKALFALKRLEQAGCIHNYAQLIERSKKNVSQNEHTIILTEKEKIVSTDRNDFW